jgi:hypothetical protein
LRTASKDKTTGYGFVGRWRDGTLGWILPDYLSGYSRGSYTEPPSPRFHKSARPIDRAVLCRITIEVVKDSRGRSIVRKPKKPTE